MQINSGNKSDKPLIKKRIAAFEDPEKETDIYDIIKTLPEDKKEKIFNSMCDEAADSSPNRMKSDVYKFWNISKKVLLLIFLIICVIMYGVAGGWNNFNQILIELGF